jgi:inner membrane protein
MPWWGWMVIGVLLFGAELLAIDAHFYLIFLGAAALAVGVADYFGMDVPIWGEWLAFAVLSIVFMLTLREQLYQRMRGRAIGSERLIGAQVQVERELGPGESCRTEHRGSTWTALNIGDRAIPAGSRARIEAVDGVTLHIRA